MDHFETSITVGMPSFDDESDSSGELFGAQTPMVSARSALKRDTDEIHQQLHELPVFADLMAGRLSLQRYQRIMNGFLNFYEEFDSAATDANRRFSQLLEGHIYVPRTPMFRADVVALGGKPPTRNAVKRYSLNFGSLAEYVGALYVVDGSVLGGLTMNKALKRNVDLNGKGGKSYWNWCQQNGLTHWQSTLRLLEKTWHRDANTAVVTNAALQTFSILHDRLSEVDTGMYEAAAHE